MATRHRDAPLQRLRWGLIAEINLGFFGLQYSFGLQQVNLGAIYATLGAGQTLMPLLWLAGPAMGILIQPIVGATSDRTRFRFGRRTPYMLVGALLGSVCLSLLPFSSSLLVAASLFCGLQAANNVTMEPYRAYISDKLGEAQRAHGFLVQGAFTGLGQTLAFLSVPALVWAGINRDALGPNGIPTVTRMACLIGAALSLATILWSITRRPEGPSVSDSPHPPEPLLRVLCRDLVYAVKNMPTEMRQMALPMFFQWFAMFSFWQFSVFSVARSLFDTSNPASDLFREAVLVNGRMGGIYNFLAFISALAVAPLTMRYGTKVVHACCLLASGIAMLVTPHMTSEAALAIPMLGIGLGWGSMMGSPYIMLARCVPAERTGIYMGLFNIFVSAPMLIESLAMPFLYPSILHSDPRNVLAFGGVFMILASITTVRIGRSSTFLSRRGRKP